MYIGLQVKCRLLLADCNENRIFWTDLRENAPYCHLCPAPLYNIFPNYLINGTILEKKLLSTKYVF